MKAMILAAGLGTRLGTLTDDRPKALVEVAGRPLLEITLARLRSFGIGEVIINVHHFAEKIIDYLAANDNFGMKIEISREEELLDTGGGLKKAAWFFLKTTTDRDDLAGMAQFHRERNALATLASQNRATSRPLLFDEHGLLHGRGGAGSTQFEALAFCGVHLLSPRILTKMQEEGAFSIIDVYVRLAAQGEKIIGFNADKFYWRDLGKPESLTKAALDIGGGLYSI
jgi:NDP-sugar pyrophosphorylase family protein